MYLFFKFLFLNGFLFLFLFSCSKSDLKQFNQINSTRVIAIMSDKPEVSPGDTVTLTPVVSDLESVSGLQDSAQVCIDAGLSIGGNPTCENNPTKIVIQSHRVLTLPGVSENWTGLADSFSVTIPVESVIFNQRSEQDKYNGVNYLVEYTLHSPSGVQIKSIKRIVVSQTSKTSKNLNPIMTDIFSDGVSMTALPISNTVNLTSDLSFSSAESYSLMGSSGVLKSFNEKLTVTWFITDGSTKYFRSEVNESNAYTGPSSAPVGRDSYILAIAKDDRGGVAVIKRKLF